jgi:hypothetical protein
VYEDSELDGEGNSWRGERCGCCSSAGFCSGEAELDAARRSCDPVSTLFGAVRGGVVARALTKSSSLFLSFLR